MIETALIYVRATEPAARFVGCGVLVEGGFIATCRHVWHLATKTAADKNKTEVEIEFPRSRRNNATARSRARRAHACDDLDDPAPDLVLLSATDIPSGCMSLQLAATDRFETGDGYALIGLPGRDEQTPGKVRDVRITGNIADHCDAEGLRQFTGRDGRSYWAESGSSGSPVFRDGGQQLAGMLRLSELGSNTGESHLQEAFVVPATMIRRHVARKLATAVMTEAKIAPAELQPILMRIGAQDIAVADIPARLHAFVEAALARGAEPVGRSNEGADIDAAIGASRARMQHFDTDGARHILQVKIAEEMQLRAQRMVPLLKERLAIERATSAHEAAKETLRELIAFQADDCWVWFDLGDLWLTTGSLTEAEKAYSSGEMAARQRRDDHGLSISHSMIGDVRLAGGDRTGALSAYKAALAIGETLVHRDPDHTRWQRRLAVSHDRIGDVRLAEGDRTGALSAYTAALAIAETLVRCDPGNAVWQRDLLVSHGKIGVVRWAEGDRPGALSAYKAALAIGETLVRRDPDHTGWQRDLSVSHDRIGDVRLAEGDRPGALCAYEAALAIRETLVRRDPGHTLWQRDVSVSHGKIGDVRLAEGDRPGALSAYKAALAIDETLVRCDPGNTDWQRNLSVSRGKIGDVKLAVGDRSGALSAYEGALAIDETLVRCDPGNTDWQRNLLVGHSKLGDVKLTAGDRPGARSAYEAALAIGETLVRRDPGNTEWHRDLFVLHAKLGLLKEQSDQQADAAVHFHQADAIIRPMAEKVPSNQQWQNYLAWVRSKLPS